MRAVISDLFGTLTDPAAEAERRPAFAETAVALGIAADEFFAAMAGSFPQRIIGAYGGTPDTLRAIRHACAVGFGVVCSRSPSVPRLSGSTGPVWARSQP